MRTIKLALAGAVVFAAGTAQAQIPVTDVANITQNMANHVEDVAKFVQQIEQLKAQVEQQKQQFAALTGSRNLGQIFDNPNLRSYLPNDWQKVYDSVKSGGYEGLSGTAADIYRDNKVFDACAAFTVADQRTACEAEAVKPSQDKAMASDAYDATGKRLDQIEQLMGQINQTQDPKAIAELQGRIGAEQAMIQNEGTRLQLYAMMAQAQDKIEAQRQHEINAKANARRGFSPLSPMEW